MKQQLNFQSFDGMLLNGILSMPPEASAALLMMHGIPSNKDEWGFYSDMADYFYDEGIATLRFDFRGCGESAMCDSSSMTLSSMVNDIDAAYWQLAQHCSRDTEIYPVGTSAGGGVTVRWSALMSRRVRRIFLMAPVLDYEYEITASRRSVSDVKPVQLGSELVIQLARTGKLNKDIGYGQQMLNEAHLFDGAKEIARSMYPITVFQGDADTVVPIAITRELLGDSKHAELIVVPGADHGFAVEGDDDLTDPLTKRNHQFVYGGMLQRIRNGA